MNDYSYVLYSEKSVLATDCYDLTPLTYEERGMLSAKKTTENGFLEETRFLEKKNWSERFSLPQCCHGIQFCI
jgi:hypothetical protein